MTTEGQPQPSTGDRQQHEPVIVEFGKRSKKQIRKLRSGRGRIMRDIESVLDELRSSGELDEDTRVLVAVVKERPEYDDGGCWWR